MASIVAAQTALDREAQGETTLEIVAVRYTGPKTLYDVTGHLTPQGWPGSAPLDGGPTRDANGSWNLALVPDETLSTLEGRPDLEVVYAKDQETQFAEVMLEAGLPSNVFDRNADLDLQERVFDALGLEPVAQAGPFRDQLEAIAFPEEDVPEEIAEAQEDEEEAQERTTAQQFVDRYDRNELGDICKELRADPSEFNLRENAEKTERAEFIASFDRQERAAAVEAALGEAPDEEAEDEEGEG